MRIHSNLVRKRELVSESNVLLKVAFLGENRNSWVSANETSATFGVIIADWCHINHSWYCFRAGLVLVASKKGKYL